MANLFEDLSALRAKPIPAVLQPGMRVTLESDGNTYVIPAPNTAPIRFEIIPLSANQKVEADRVLDAAKPVAIFQKEARAGTVGVVEVHAGWDHDHPDTVAARSALIPRRRALICLFGCPALMETTPGTTLDEKVGHLLTTLPDWVLGWLASELENEAALTGVGEREVAAFFPEGSADSGSSKSSSGRSPARKKPKR